MKPTGVEVETEADTTVATATMEGGATVNKDILGDAGLTEPNQDMDEDSSRPINQGINSDPFWATLSTLDSEINASFFVIDGKVQRATIALFLVEQNGNHTPICHPMPAGQLDLTPFGVQLMIL